MEEITLSRILLLLMAHHRSHREPASLRNHRQLSGWRMISYPCPCLCRSAWASNKNNCNNTSQRQPISIKNKSACNFWVLGPGKGLYGWSGAKELTYIRVLMFCWMIPSIFSNLFRASEVYLIAFSDNSNSMRKSSHRVKLIYKYILVLRCESYDRNGTLLLFSLVTSFPERS